MSSNFQLRAACAAENAELFFPAGNSGPELRQEQRAKAICAKCPVQTECLTWALDAGQNAGIWGGMTGAERRALKRQEVPA